MKLNHEVDLPSHFQRGRGVAAANGESCRSTALILFHDQPDNSVERISNDFIKLSLICELLEIKHLLLLNILRDFFFQNIRLPAISISKISKQILNKLKRHGSTGHPYTATLTFLLLVWRCHVLIGVWRVGQFSFNDVDN